MVETIRAYARSDAGVLGQQGLSERVLEAMGQTKRHLFIPERSCSIAYADRPIPIGLGQTISQPFIVALMTSWPRSRPIMLCSKSVRVRAIRPPSLLT